MPTVSGYGGNFVNLLNTCTFVIFRGHSKCKHSQVSLLAIEHRSSRNIKQTHKSETQGILCKVANDNHSQTMEEYFQMLFHVIMLSSVMTGQ